MIGDWITNDCPEMNACNNGIVLHAHTIIWPKAKLCVDNFGRIFSRVCIISGDIDILVAHGSYRKRQVVVKVCKTRS